MSHPSIPVSALSPFPAPYSAIRTTAAPLTGALLTADDPAVVTWYHPPRHDDADHPVQDSSGPQQNDASTRVLLLCDHAGNRIPRRLAGLGLSPAAQITALERHIAYDLGAAALTRRLADHLQAPAILSVYSRLVVDLNRAPDDPTFIPEISDGEVIHGNRHLTPAVIAAREAELFAPYHAAIAGWIAARRAAGIVPALLSIHSFTPVMHEFARPWQVGILWDRDPRLPLPLMERLRCLPGVCVGDNQPYSGRNTGGGTIETHATPAGLPNVLIEVRQDVLESADGIALWAERLAAALAPSLAEESLYQVAHFT